MSAFTEAILVETHRASFPLAERWLEGRNYDSTAYRRFLYHLCKLARVEVAIELGVAEGCTTLHLAAAGLKGVVGVDIAPEMLRFAENCAIWRTAYPGVVSIVVGDSVAKETVERVGIALDSLGAKANLLYIDSLHEAKHAAREWELYRPLLAPGAVVAMDDIKDPAEMYPVFQAIPGEHLELDFLHEVYRGGNRPQSVGWGIIILD